MNDLPDLPSLESVEVKESVISPLGGLIVLLMSPLLWLICRSYRLLSDAPDVKQTLLVGIVACSALFMYGLQRILLEPYYWSTDSSGLQIRSLLRRRFLRWEDNVKFPKVTSASDTYTRKLVLAASIWQHVRKYRGPGAYELPQTALSLWDEIPGTIPSTFDWEDPRHFASMRKSTGVLTVLGLAVIAALLVAGRCPAFHQYSDAMPLLVVVLSAAVTLTGSLYIISNIQPERITLDGRVVQVQLRDRVVSAEPSDIASAEWYDAGRYQTGVVLVMKTDKLKGARIAVRSTDKGSKPVILALIRWLRTSPTAPPVIIPESLRS